MTLGICHTKAKLVAFPTSPSQDGGFNVKHMPVLFCFFNAALSRCPNIRHWGGLFYRVKEAVKGRQLVCRAKGRQLGFLPS